MEQKQEVTLTQWKPSRTTFAIKILESRRKGHTRARFFLYLFLALSPLLAALATELVTPSSSKVWLASMATLRRTPATNSLGPSPALRTNRRYDSSFCTCSPFSRAAA